MITRNLWTSEGLVNGTMGTVYDIIWEDGVDDPFTTMPAVILVAVNNYFGRASIIFNGINVMPVVPAEAQWEVKYEVCQRKQFPLILAFAITIHKSQGLTLPRVVLNFEHKDFTPGLSYVALSRVRAIQDVMFETSFSRDRFPEMPTPLVRRRIAEGLARRYNTVEHLERSITQHQEESTQPVSQTPPTAVSISSSPVNQGLYDDLKDMTIGEALQHGAIQQIQDLVSMSYQDLIRLLRDIRNKDDIALIIGTFPLLHFQPNGEYRPFVTGYRLGMALYIDMFNLYTLLDGQWLSSGAIDGVLAELAVLSPGVQLMSSEKAFYHLCKLQRHECVSADDVINILPDTHTLVFPFNLSGNHWCVAKATCHRKIRLLTIYNSLARLDKKRPRIDEELIKTWPPPELDCIINANIVNANLLNNIPILQWTDSEWASDRVVQGDSLRQSDCHGCGIYTIFNALALVKQQEPSLNQVNPRALRVEYARALVNAV